MGHLIDLSQSDRTSKRQKHNTPASSGNGRTMDAQASGSTPAQMRCKSEETVVDLDTPSTAQLVTSGVRRVILPSSCNKESPGWDLARKKLARDEVNRLKALGLKESRIFVRTDGMVIDWTSPKPVWNDTLKPDDPQRPRYPSKSPHQETPLVRKTKSHKRSRLSGTPVSPSRSLTTGRVPPMIATPITNLKLRSRLQGCRPGSSPKNAIILDGEVDDEDLPLRMIVSRRSSTQTSSSDGSHSAPNINMASTMEIDRTPSPAVFPGSSLTPPRAKRPMLENSPPASNDSSHSVPNINITSTVEIDRTSWAAVFTGGSLTPPLDMRPTIENSHPTSDVVGFPEGPDDASLGYPDDTRDDTEELQNEASPGMVLHNLTAAASSSGSRESSSHPTISNIILPPTTASVKPDPPNDSVTRDEARQFLERYLLVFRNHRRDLVNSYTPDASFSYRFENAPSDPSLGSTEIERAGKLPEVRAQLFSAPAKLERRTNIVNFLRSWRLYTLRAWQEGRLDFEFTPLDSSLVQLKTTGYLSAGGQKSAIIFKQSFDLCKKGLTSDSDKATESLWDVVAVAHDMTLSYAPANP